ncbi:MAG: hypothetical protein EON58_14430 [Alphaproteobacteria bacterium]|nr:MAG: hypothetical protein EON58_14430 [Alphaproteobacteria bacterium]
MKFTWLIARSALLVSSVYLRLETKVRYGWKAVVPAQNAATFRQCTHATITELDRYLESFPSG